MTYAEAERIRMAFHEASHYVIGEREGVEMHEINVEGDSARDLAGSVSWSAPPPTDRMNGILYCRRISRMTLAGPFGAAHFDDSFVRSPEEQELCHLEAQDDYKKVASFACYVHPTNPKARTAWVTRMALQAGRLVEENWAAITELAALIDVSAERGKPRLSAEDVANLRQKHFPV